MIYRIEEVDEDKAIAHITGDITFSENVRFRQLLSDLVEKEVTHCTFDLSEVKMVDSSGLGMFQVAKEQADTSNWTLTVEGASGHVASLLKLTRLNDLLEN